MLYVYVYLCNICVHIYTYTYVYNAYIYICTRNVHTYSFIVVQPYISDTGIPFLWEFGCGGWDGLACLVQGQGVAHGAHAKLTDAEAEVPAMPWIAFETEDKP